MLMGRTGAVAASPILASYLGDPSILAYANRLADELLHAADKNGPGYSWASSVHPIGRNLTGFSHGSAGVGYALLELWNVTREPLLREAAIKAFEYERHWFDADAGNWPDFRLDPGEKARKRTGSKKGRGENWPFATAWCNGAPGIALSRLRAFELLADEDCKADALIGLRTTQRDVEANLASPGAGFSLCHGLAGNSQVLLYGHEVLGSDWPSGARLATAVAAQGVELYANSAHRWPCGVTRGSTPNLMLGLAGIGHFYLRMYNPAVPSILLLRREEWTASSSARPLTQDVAAVV
jgi:class II lanthipeptide synthase